ncbi:MAG: hypothetical protein Q8928_01905 [Bacteroidota bacterium]|nr:hypothetical protein [Bacteroidota bacterium]
METPKKLTNEKKTGEEQKIDRKQALVKAGYIAFSAATMMMLFSNPAKADPGTSGTPGSLP